MSESMSALYLSNPQLAIALRRRLEAEAQMKQGTGSEPIRSPWQGVNNLANALIGGWQAGKQDQDIQGNIDAQNAELSDFQQGLASALQGQHGGGQQAPAAMPSAPPAPMGGAPAPMPMSGAPSQPNADFVSSNLPHAMEAARQTGLDPRLILAQSALETGFGRSAPGNNYFGIKGQGQNLPTQESVNGQMVPTQASFRAYGSPGESFQDYAKFLRENPRYAPVLAAQGLDGQIEAMGRSGYATDPQYGQKLRAIAQGIQLPTQVASAPMPGTATDAPTGMLPPAQQEPQPGMPSGAAPPQGGPTPPPPLPGGAIQPGQPVPTPPVPPGLPPMAPGGNQSALMQIYMRGISSNNPRVQRIAAGLAPFIKQDDASVVVGAGGQLRNRMTGALIAENNNDSATTRVTVANDLRPANEYGTQVSKGLAERDVAYIDAARGAPEQIDTAKRIRALIDSGAITGPGADIRLGLAKGLNLVGATDSETIARTQNLVSELARVTQEQIKSSGLGGGSGFSNADRDFLERARAGTIAYTPEALKYLSDLNERGARLAITNGNRALDRVRRIPGMDAYFGNQPAFSDELPPQGGTAPPVTIAPPGGAAPAVGAPPNAAPQQSGPPLVATPSDAAKLPPGTLFRTPDGRVMRVPQPQVPR